MTSEKWRRIAELFELVVELEPDKRESILKQASAGDESILKEVRELLSNLDESNNYLSNSPISELKEEFPTYKKLPAGQIIGKFKIIRHIGEGGLGQVYLAIDTSLNNREVALKFLSSQFNSKPEQVERFKQEARALSALNHPNILTIFEFGTVSNMNFLVSEFVKGETLRERLNRNRLPIPVLFDISTQIVSALAAAHQASVIHRDIKPENVMIRTDGIVKVLDFGLVKFLEKTSADKDTEHSLQTQAGTILGTAAYMSPEQASEKEIDARTDIFSFGCVLYEMLTDQQPFKGETIFQTIMAILLKEPPPLAEFVKDYPSELERIIFKALAKNADERYQTTNEFLIDLKKLRKELDFQEQLEHSLPPDKSTENLSRDSDEETIRQNISLPPTNLSEDYTLIVGREKEIAEIKNLLTQDGVQLVTLTGVGGTGKTTLALAVARELLTEFADGVFFAELSAITNPDLVMSTIAQPLGAMEAGGKPIIEVLKDFLRERKILIVIDNFEQVIEAAPQISELLSSIRKLKILITSRTLLRLRAEYNFVVPPLAVPSDAASLSFDELSNYEAIKLFVERAQHAKSQFSLTKENARTVAEICSRLDGLPLAIELAAARVKILKPQVILTKLENRLHLLTGGARDLPTRQQTMRGAVEWSYELLGENEKRLFRQLAVFTGGFTFEAAEIVVSDSLVGDVLIKDKQPQMTNLNSLTIDVLEGITSLVDESLLVAKEQSDDETRFRMLEVVREYALEMLEASREAEAVRHSHAAYFLALGEEAEPHLQAAQSAKWLNRLEEEHDNLRAALGWLLGNDAVKAARLAGAIRSFWALHSHLTEGRKWLKAALERGSLAPTAVRFKLLNGLGLVARNQGDYETAQKAYEGGLAAGRAENDLRQIAWSNMGLGMIAYQQGDFAAARKFYEEGLAFNRMLNNNYGVAVLLSFLGDLARAEGNYAAARPLFEESLGIARQLGNKPVVSANLNNLGSVFCIEGNFAAARSHFSEALKTVQELGDKILISYSLDGFAALAAESGESKLATQLAGAALHLRESIGYEIEPAERRFRDAYVSELKTKLDEADFTKAYEQGRKMKLKKAIALALD